MDSREQMVAARNARDRLRGFASRFSMAACFLLHGLSIWSSGGFNEMI
jgi:hypothetical protein